MISAIPSPSISATNLGSVSKFYHPASEPKSDDSFSGVLRLDYPFENATYTPSLFIPTISAFPSPSISPHNLGVTSLKKYYKFIHKNLFLIKNLFFFLSIYYC